MLSPVFFLRALLPVLVFIFTCPAEISAGSYGDSAHGSGSIGVNRGVTRDNGYARGNCGHCHEQHSSIDGVEPAPGNGATAYSLFYQNFNSTAMTSPYLETDNFCFFCHSTLTSSGQSVTNFDYSRSFGCGTSGETDIRSTLNQLSNHNLYDIYNWAKTEFSWFTDASNPCNACHNPHLAKNNADNAADPIFSAISKPSDHTSLWGSGITETMGNQYGTSYEPLFCADSHSNREPAASSNVLQARESTPDYVGFCTDCHTGTANIYSTSLGRYLKKIEWGVGGDKHGAQLTDGRFPHNSNSQPIIGGGSLTQPPYVIGNDYVLSCLDCHEPHGSPNVMLLRRRVNGGNLAINITSIEDEPSDDTDNKDMGYLCLKCHYDDKSGRDAGLVGSLNENDPNVWRYIHHMDATGWDTPYGGGGGAMQGQCGDLSCHGWSGNGMGTPHCNDCHFHGSVITIEVGNQANKSDSTRKTF